MRRAESRRAVRGTTASFNEAAQQIESARATVGDVSATLRDYAERINASPERLAEIEDRLALLDRLKRKYGKTMADVIALGEEVARKLAEVEDRDETLKVLRAALAKSAECLQAGCHDLVRAAQDGRREAGQTGRNADQFAGDEGDALRFRCLANEEGIGMDRARLG